jgi:hypothetical protein
MLARCLVNFFLVLGVLASNCKNFTTTQCMYRPPQTYLWWHQELSASRKHVDGKSTSQVLPFGSSGAKTLPQCNGQGQPCIPWSLC